MSETIRVLGIDPSLRKTGFAVVVFNTETETFSVEACGVAINPQKYTGLAAIDNMLGTIQEIKEDGTFGDYTDCIIECPPAIFNPKFPASSLLPIAHISGGCAIIFDLKKIEMVYPVQWNKRRKKDHSHNETVKILGEPHTWKFFCDVKDPHMEHVLDAASMALWYIKQKYLEESTP